MKTHIFTGATSREVLHKVKQALGDDALILSNRERDGVIEVVALCAADMIAMRAGESAAAAAPPKEAPVPPGVPRAVIFPRVDAPARPERLATAADARETPRPRPAPEAQPALPAAVQPRREERALAEAAPAAAAAPAPAADRASDIDGILSEIQNLKSMLRTDIAAYSSMEAASGRPAYLSRTSVMRDLLCAGFSAKLARDLAGDPQAPDARPATMGEVAARLERELVVAEEDEIIRDGGIYALVGPTGVGKTTTIAKLAARAVVRFGASKVALLTTDSYRIGAHDQLRIYGRILNVPVHAIRDAEDLATVLAELSDRHLVLIDTIGMSQRDRMVAEQAALLAGGGQVKRLLLVATTANTGTLNQVVSAYKSSGVHGCILTKTDEAASLAPALDAVIRHGLPVHYITDGQRVPEDLQIPDAAILVRDALRPLDDEAMHVTHDEVELVTPPVPAAFPAAEGTRYTAEPAMPMHAVPPVREMAARVVHG